MKSLKSLAITSAFLLTGGIALAAPPQSAASPQKSATPPQTQEYQRQSMNNNGKPANTQRAEHHVIGTVDNISSSSVTVSHKYKGRQRTTDFQVQPSTKKEGNIAQGTRVEVYYKTVNNQHIATMMKAEPSAS